MTDNPQTPHKGIADAIGDLSEQSQTLVREEIDAARREAIEKAKASAPALGLASAATALGLLAAASSYRWSVRLLEKALSPASAAFVATAGYGAAAAGAAGAAARRLRRAPAPFPTETAKRAGALARETAAEARR